MRTRRSACSLDSETVETGSLPWGSRVRRESRQLRQSHRQMKSEATMQGVQRASQIGPIPAQRRATCVR
jgi:hypothetical protein